MHQVVSLITPAHTHTLIYTMHASFRLSHFLHSHFHSELGARASEATILPHPARKTHRRARTHTHTHAHQEKHADIKTPRL